MPFLNGQYFGITGAGSFTVKVETGSEIRRPESSTTAPDGVVHVVADTEIGDKTAINKAKMAYFFMYVKCTTYPHKAQGRAYTHVDSVIIQ